MLHRAVEHHHWTNFISSPLRLQQSQTRRLFKFCSRLLLSQTDSTSCLTDCMISPSPQQQRPRTPAVQHLPRKGSAGARIENYILGVMSSLARARESSTVRASRRSARWETDNLERLFATRECCASTFLLFPQCARGRLGLDHHNRRLFVVVVVVSGCQEQRDPPTAKPTSGCPHRSAMVKVNPRAAVVGDGALPPLSVLLSCSAVRAVFWARRATAL